MGNPGESASLTAKAKARLPDVRKRTDIWDFAAENSVRIPYLRRSVSRIRQAPLSNPSGISARSQPKTLPPNCQRRKRIPTQPYTPEAESEMTKSTNTEVA